MNKEECVPSKDSPETKPVCGIVMPISAIDGCPEEHWGDVREVLFDATEAAGYEARMVSDADEVGIIQKRIIQNLYTNPMVVCDVSGKNPNVMFELGMRLAFDKPCVIVKDDKTTYSFDPSPMEHLEYPRDLRYNRIVEFKSELAEKVAATGNQAAKDPDYSPFLKHFGTFTVAKLNTKAIPKEEYILEELAAIHKAVDALRGSHEVSRPPAARGVSYLCLQKCPVEVAQGVLAALSSASPECGLSLHKMGSSGIHHHIHVMDESLPDWNAMVLIARNFAPNAQIHQRRAPR